jgi:magnesium-transporting ATPase (P-type)
MNFKAIFSFLFSALIHLVTLQIVVFAGYILVLGLFDTTSTIQQFETERLYELMFYISVSIILGIVSFLLLRKKKKYFFWGGMAVILIYIFIRIFEYQSNSITKPFDKQEWLQSSTDKFVTAKSIVLNKSFTGMEKEKVIANLGSPDFAEDNKIKYNINDEYDWTLIITFDGCCVANSELIKEPWNL